jgi:hypothetical protein
MNYAIEVLQKEKVILEKCLSEWDEKKYPEARNQRNEKLKDLQKTIEILKTNRLSLCKDKT